MAKFFVFVLTSLICSTSFAEPVVYICERPAWEGVKGCGPNNTYYTYTFQVETDDFNGNAKDRVYAFDMKKGCEPPTGKIGKAYNYTFQDEDNSIKFWTQLQPNFPATSFSFSRVHLDLEFMTAVMDGVIDSQNLTCREETTDPWGIHQAKLQGGVKAPTATYLKKNQASSSSAPSISSEIRALIAEVQSDYMNCMVPKLPEYDDSESDVALVAAALRKSCTNEAANGADKLRTVDASPEFRNALVEEYWASLEGHSTNLVNQWRDHINYREPPNHRFREGSQAES